MMKKVTICLLIILMILVIPITSVNAASKTIGDLQKELEAEQKKLEDNKTQKAINSQNLSETRKKIDNIKNDISQVEKNIEDKENESKQLEKDIEKKNDETEDLMRYYQVSSSGSAMLEYIMGAESLTDLIYRLSITEQISSYNEKLVDEMNDMIDENEKIKKDLESEKERLKGLKSDLETQEAVLSQKQSELEDAGESNEKAIKSMQEEIKYYKSLGCDNSYTIDGCLSKLYGGGSSGGYLPSGTTFYRPTTSGRISSEFGKRTLFGSANNHFAIDIAMPIGTNVYSVAPGIVGDIGRVCGISVVVWHNINGQTYSSLYCHLSKTIAKKGQVVTKDTIIAKSGNTGISTGPHLHLGLATGKYKADYYLYYGSSGSFESHTFNPRNVITFPPLGSSYYNR